MPHLLDYGARSYDPLTCSWTTPDPLAHKYLSWSPYTFCTGDPVNFVDPDGMSIWTVTLNGRVLTINECLDYDQIVVGTEDGEVLFSSDRFPINTFISLSEVNSFIEIKTRDVHAVRNVFTVLANNSTVEYGLIGTYDSNYSIFTDGFAKKIDLISKAYSLEKENHAISIMIHSHPGSSKPSGFDRQDYVNDMKNLLIILLQISTGLFPWCYSAKPSMFLKKYISEFRKEYNVQPSEVIALSTWSDSSHFYLDGVVIDGNEVIEKSDLIICREATDNFLYKSRGEKLERRADRSVEYDDAMTFRLCFHNDRTVCDLYSYEICTEYGIPALSRVEKRFHKGVKGLDPDCYNLFYPGQVQEPVKCDNWIELTKELTEEIYQQGIRYPYRKMVIISVYVNRSGEAVSVFLPRETGDKTLDEKLIEVCGPILMTQHYTPAKLRGYSVDAFIGAPVFLNK